MESFLACIASVWQPHPGQREFLLNSAKIKVLACGRRWGKTDACAVSIVAALFRDSPTRHVILAPTLDQAKILFDRVVELLEKVEGRRSKNECTMDGTAPENAPGATESKISKSPPKGNRRSDHNPKSKIAGGSPALQPDLRPSSFDLQIRRSPYPKLTYNGHTVLARSGHLGRSLRGSEATHIVVDEAAYVPEELITEVAMPMLATTEGCLTMISTPRGLNHFWRFFKMGQEGLHGVWNRRAPSSENPLVSASYLEVQKELISERAYRVEYEAEFLDVAGTVFRTESIDRCTVPRLTDAPFAPFFIGVDWARYTDYTAVAVVCGSHQGAMLVELDRFHGLTWAEQLARVRSLVEGYPQARVLCDQTGLGGDVLLEELRKGLTHAGVGGLVFTSTTKAQIVEKLVWLFDNGALKFEPHPELLRELQHFEATVSPSGNRKLGARSGFHDDLVVALALACRDLPSKYDPGMQVGKPRNFSSARRARFELCPI